MLVRILETKITGHQLTKVTKKEDRCFSRQENTVSWKRDNL